MSYSLGRILGSGKNLASGTNISTQKEYRFDEKFLGQELALGQAVCFLSDGKMIRRPSVIHLSKLFEGRVICSIGKISYVTDEKKIFENIGKVDVEKIENTQIDDLLREEERICSDRIKLTKSPDNNRDKEHKKEIVFVDEPDTPEKTFLDF